MKDWRIVLVAILLILFGLGLLARLAFLQIVNHGFYKALAHGQQTLPELATGQRGTITVTDKNGTRYTVATNQRSPFVFVTPVEVEDKEKTREELSSLLNVPKEEIDQKLSHQESLFEVIKRSLTAEEAAAVQALGLEGVYVEEEIMRFYPQDTFASRLVGFANQDGIGQYGVEKQYQEELTGKQGLKKTIRNVAGYLLSGIKDTSKDGNDVHLTIDFHIQSMAESLLKKAKDQIDIEEGTVIVMDPQTGNILALANYPTFNPNSYSEVQNLKLFQNPAIESVYEPGSVFKPLTMASAINQGAVTPLTTYEDKGIIRIGGYKILNYDERIWGERTMTEVLEYSINTGAVFAEQQLGHKKFLEYLERFGIFQPTNIDLSGEVYSQNRELKKGYEINFATASFGQGVEMTAMQVLRAFSALASGGKMVTPHVTEQEAQFSDPVISEKTASHVTAMLVSVTENGFGKAARVPGYYVAGKTGTAQVSFAALGENKAGYSGKTIQSFIGYAPAFQPRFIVLVKLLNPKTRTAEYSAIPVFQELTKYILDYYEVPPDYEQ